MKRNPLLTIAAWAARVIHLDKFADRFKTRETAKQEAPASPSENPHGKNGGGGARIRRSKHHRAWKKLFGGIACHPYRG